MFVRYICDTMAIKPIYKQIVIGFLTVGVTVTTTVLIAQQIRKALGKGAGQKEATLKDKNEMEIVFVKNKNI